MFTFACPSGLSLGTMSLVLPLQAAKSSGKVTVHVCEGTFPIPTGENKK